MQQVRSREDVLKQAHHRRIGSRDLWLWIRVKDLGVQGLGVQGLRPGISV